MSACLSGARDWYAGSCVRQCVVSVEKKKMVGSLVDIYVSCLL